MTKNKASKRTRKKGAEPKGEQRGDRITVRDVRDHANVAAGQDASVISTVITYGSSSDMAEWRSQMEQKIDSQPTLSTDDKQDLRETVAKVESEASKGEKAEPGRLERLIGTLAPMSPDIWEVAVTTLVNPLSGIGLVVKKIGDRVKVERQSQAA